MESYRKRIFLGIILIALGITMNSSLNTGSIGTVFIAVGGLFFILGMKTKRDIDEHMNGD